MVAPFKPTHQRFSHAKQKAQHTSLEELDKVKFGWQQVRSIMIAGIGFFTDAYDIFSINMVSVLLGLAYYRDSENKGKLPGHLDEGLKIATSAGAIAGQLFFGFISDRFGRSKIYGLELLIILVATIATALAGNGPSFNVVHAVIFYRLVLGFGIGGDYPQSAVITSEFSTTRYRGRMMASVFSMQGLGIMASSFVFLFCVLGFKNDINNEVLEFPMPTTIAEGNKGLPSADKMWRIIIGLGALPGLCALYFRLTIPESPRQQEDKANFESGMNDIISCSGVGASNEDDLKKPAKGVPAASSFSDTEAEAGSSSPPSDPQIQLNQNQNQNENQNNDDRFVKFQNTLLTPKALFTTWRWGKILLATAGCWFCLDIAFYGLGLNNSIILQAIGYAGQSDTYTNLYNIAVGNIVLNLAGTLPGYWFTIAFVDKIGRKPIQLFGFAILTALFIVLGFAYWPLYHEKTKAAFIVLFVLAQFFQNFGPNATTYIYPAEVYPTKIRSTAHGISAATGKFGAVIAQVVFSPLANKGGEGQWINHILQIFALFMFIGFFLTFLLPETKNKSLEDISEGHGKKDLELNEQNQAI